jgi:hypothetical protein
LIGQISLHYSGVLQLAYDGLHLSL